MITDTNAHVDDKRMRRDAVAMGQGALQLRCLTHVCPMMQEVDCDSVVGMSWRQDATPSASQSLGICYADGRQGLHVTK